MDNGYNGNTQFYQRANNSTLTLKDIFSDVLKKHDKREGERLFIAGTSASTPSPNEMLREWSKPWLFLRVLFAGLGLLLLLYIMIMQGFGAYAITPFAFFGAAVVPVAVLLFYWEMNIPRNIPIYQIMVMFLIGGCISLLLTGFFQGITGDYPVYLAPITEEPAKLLALCIFLRKPNRNYILNGILIGGAIGAGFAVIETAGYFWNSGFVLSTLVERALLSPGGHVIWAAIYGGALAKVKGNRKFSFEYFMNFEFLKFFAAAFILHFLWNSSFSILAIPFFVDVKYIILIIAAWLILLKVIKAGVQQVLGLTGSSSSIAAEMQTVMPVLYGIKGIYAGQSIPLSSGKIVFGRDLNTCNIIFPKDTAGISRQHCTVTSDGKNVWICDDGSSNGTFLGNGERLQAGRETLLSRGQRFFLADMNTMFEIR